MYRIILTVETKNDVDEILAALAGDEENGGITTSFNTEIEKYTTTHEED